VMPNGMNGVELAREARRLSKGIKILHTSGYARDVLERHGAVDEFPVIDKPYRLADLAAAAVVNPARSLRTSRPAFASSCGNGH
jgi:CheY-like chemotaxis protein